MCVSGAVMNTDMRLVPFRRPAPIRVGITALDSCISGENLDLRGTFILLNWLQLY